jgi:hypothetical protein
MQNKKSVIKITYALILCLFGWSHPTFAIVQPACGAGPVNDFANIASLNTTAIGADCTSAIANCLSNLNHSIIPPFLMREFSCPVCPSPKVGCSKVTPADTTLTSSNVISSCSGSYPGPYTASCTVNNDFIVLYRAECTACITPPYNDCNE